jgi:hypothetical protein
MNFQISRFDPKAGPYCNLLDNKKYYKSNDPELIKINMVLDYCLKDIVDYSAVATIRVDRPAFRFCYLGGLLSSIYILLA